MSKMVTLYSIQCPKCLLLEKKLLQTDVKFTVCEDVDIMESKGFEILPMLEVDGQIMDYNEALKWATERSLA